MFNSKSPYRCGRRRRIIHTIRQGYKAPNKWKEYKRIKEMRKLHDEVLKDFAYIIKVGEDLKKLIPKP